MASSSMSRAWRRRGATRRAALLLLSGLTFVIAPGASAMAHSLSPDRASRNLYADNIEEASQRFGIPTRWIITVLRAESAGDDRALSSAGAIGLMQLMPDTWAELRNRHRLGRDPFNPRDNVLAGAAYLRELWDRYGNVAAMLAAYNAGPARYDKHRSHGSPLPPETRAYVDKLVPALGVERPANSPSAVARSSDWRESAIFLARESAMSNTHRDAPGRAAGSGSPRLPAASDAIIASHSGDLFARGAGLGARP